MADEKSAKEYFSTHAFYPAVRVKLFDWETKFADPLPRQESERLKDIVEILDAHADAYLPLVGNPESHKEYEKLLSGVKERALTAYMGIHPGLLFYHGKSEWELTINRRIRHWINEGYKRMIPDDLKEKRSGTARPGYRSEMDEWMEGSGIANLDDAARELGIGVDTLKSIRSDKGAARYGDDTLQDFLAKTGIAKK
jgi:hypothetical protein